MNRYAVFAGPTYYAEGGWGDFIGSYGNREEAYNEALTHIYNEKYSTWWWHVVDLDSGELTESQCGYGALNQGLTLSANLV